MKIDPNSHVPIYLQIVEGIRVAIASGVYRPGEVLPSLRELAVDLKVNPNTVQKAYDALEREGLTVSRRGLGMFVTRRGTQSAQSQAEAAVQEAFKQGITVGRAANLGPDRMRELFDLALEKALSHTRR